jgi:hypothetical protein
MRKLLSVTMVLLVAATLLMSNSQNDTKPDKRDVKRETKAAMSQIKKDKYKLLELGDLQKKLEEYFISVENGSVQVVGTSDDCISINLAKITALNNAANEYATLSGGFVRGRIVSNVSSIGDAQVDDIVASYERLIYKELKGELMPSIILVKEKRDRFSVRAYCLIDGDSAHKAKMKAMLQALEENHLAKQYGSDASNWIDEGFNKNVDVVE